MKILCLLYHNQCRIQTLRQGGVPVSKKKTFSALRASVWSKNKGRPGPSPDPPLITCNQTFFRGLIAQKLPQKWKGKKVRTPWLQVNDDTTLYRSLTVKGRASYLALVISDCFLVHVILKATFISGIIISLRVSVTKWSQD